MNRLTRLCTAVFGLFLFLLLTRSLVAQAKPADKPAPDVLVFTNGDQLTGKLVSAAGGSVTFASDMAGNVTVSLDKVKELRSGTVFVALKKVPPTRIPAAISGTVAVEARQVTITPPNAAPQQMPAGDLAYLVDPKTYDKNLGESSSFFRGWAGTANFGGSLVRSTTSTTTLTGSVALARTVSNVAYLPKRNRTTLNINESYGNSVTPVIPPPVPIATDPNPITSTSVKTSIFHADGERDEYINPRLYGLVNVSFDHNYGSSIALQQTYGGGLGWTPIQNAKHELDLKGEVQFEQQDFITAPGSVTQPTLEIFGSTFQENYKRTLPKKIVLTEMANILPAWNDLQAYSANANLSLTLPVWRKLGATIGATDNYVNNPAQYYRTNTVQFVTSLTYTIP